MNFIESLSLLSPRFSKITRSSDGDEYCLMYLIYKKTTRRFKHCEEAWRVLVLQRYVKIMIQLNILLIFIIVTVPSIVWDYIKMHTDCIHKDCILLKYIYIYWRDTGCNRGINIRN